MEVYAAQKNKFRVHIQPTKGEFEKYLADGYTIVQEEPEEKVIARFGYPDDLKDFKYPELATKITIGGNN